MAGQNLEGPPCLGFSQFYLGWLIQEEILCAHDVWWPKLFHISSCLSCLLMVKKQKLINFFLEYLPCVHCKPRQVWPWEVHLRPPTSPFVFKCKYMWQGVSKVFARRATCDEMNIRGGHPADVHCSHLTTILSVGRIPFILWIKPRAGQNLIKRHIWPAGPTLDRPDIWWKFRKVKDKIFIYSSSTMSLKCYITLGEEVMFFKD